MNIEILAILRHYLKFNLKAAEGAHKIWRVEGNLVLCMCT